ncbi:MAG: hypothetical protein ACOCTI_06185 [Phycisphaeraceae bacterium]
MKQRLTAEGRWDAFVQRRERIKARLVGEGQAKQDAAKQAWADAADEFPPPGPGESAPTPAAASATLEPAASGESSRLAELASAAKERSANGRQVIEWVANHLHIPLEAIDPEGVPNPAAVGLLEWAKQPGSRAEFWKAMYTKTLPSKSQMEEELERFLDDGRDVLELLGKVSQASAEARMAAIPEADAEGDAA